MSTNPSVILADFQRICAGLALLAKQPASGTTAFEMEASVFERVIEIGAVAMSLFFASQSADYHWPAATTSEGSILPYSDERTAIYYSIFGEIAFSHSYYCGGGQGLCPMDGALNLPEKGASDFQRKMVEDLALSMSFAGASAFIAKYFPVSTSTRAVQQAIQSDSADAEAFYAVAAPAPPRPPAASILAVQADGKGVPMVKRSLTAPVADTLQPGKPKSDAVLQPGKPKSDAVLQPGKPKSAPRREGKTREATVVSVSTHVPRVRTPEQVHASLFEDTCTHSDDSGIASKRVWATMKGKANALSQAQVWTLQVDGDQIQSRIRLTDGLPSLQKAAASAFPDHVPVLDFIHALGYLWKAAGAKYGSNSDAGTQWVHGRSLQMLRGQTVDIVRELDDWLRSAKGAAIDPLETVANYLERNIPFMQYDKYLAAGWPIATGMIEGACRHVVKDRCEGSGMRWTEEGVEALLHLRCVYQNGDWDTYHRFRMQQRHQRAYGASPVRIGEMVDETSVYRFSTRGSLATAV